MHATMLQVQGLVSCFASGAELVWEMAVQSHEAGASITAQQVDAALTNFRHQRSTASCARRLAHVQSHSNACCTPPCILALVPQVFNGSIDLNPCSNALAQALVQVSLFFYQTNDGLHQHWSGKVFVIPPFGMVAGKSQQGLFLEKSISEYSKGHVSEVLLLLKAAIGYNWLRQALKFPHAWLCKIVAVHGSNLSLLNLESLLPLLPIPMAALQCILEQILSNFVGVFSSVAHTPCVNFWRAISRH